MANPVNGFPLRDLRGIPPRARIALGWTVRITHGDASFEWPHWYAAAAEINWTNQK
jgi:hypothetical protein